MLELAREAGGAGHHFRVLQLPLNLFEAGAALERNNGPGHAPHRARARRRRGRGGARQPAAERHGGRRACCGWPTWRTPPDAVDLDAQLAVLAGLEDEYRREIASHLEAAEGGVPPDRVLPLGRGPRGRVRASPGPRALGRPGVAADPAPPAAGPAGARPGAERAAGRVVAGLARRATCPSCRRALGAPPAPGRGASPGRGSSEVEAKLDPLLPEARRGETLSRKALWVVASTPGRERGAERRAHARRTSTTRWASSRWPPLPDAVAVLERFAAEAD